MDCLGNSVSLRMICGGFKGHGGTAEVIGNMHWNLNERERLKVRLLIRCRLFWRCVIWDPFLNRLS